MNSCKAHLISLQEAAKTLGQTEDLLRRSLIQGLVPFGYAVKGTVYDYRNREQKATYRYIIYRKRLIAYIEAHDLNYKAYDVLDVASKEDEAAS